MTDAEAMPFYRTGFQYASTAVIFTILAGAFVAAYQTGIIGRRHSTSKTSEEVPVPTQADD